MSYETADSDLLAAGFGGGQSGQVGRQQQQQETGDLHGGGGGFDNGRLAQLG